MPAASPELPRMLLGELATIVRYRLNIKIVVIKNNTLGQKEPARTMLQE
jgi:thiamine pyrophosphate-dependent acetolactate synthase large subunit-like protein